MKFLYKNFYAVCLGVSVFMFSLRCNKLIPIERDGFMSNFNTVNRTAINVFRTILVAPWYCTYIHSEEFFCRAYQKTRQGAYRDKIVSCAYIRNSSEQLKILEGLNDKENLYIKVYRYYLKMFPFFNYYHSPSIFQKSDPQKCFWLWFLVLLHNFFLFLIFDRNRFFALGLLIAPFISLRLLLVFYSGIACSELVFYNKKLKLRHILVCPYVLLSSASTVLFILFTAVSQLIITNKICICLFLSCLVYSKLESNNQIVNNQIVNNQIVNNQIVNNLLFKVKYFIKRAPLFRNFNNGKKLMRCLFIGILFLIFLLALISKTRNRYCFIGGVSFFLEGCIIVFFIPFLFETITRGKSIHEIFIIKGLR